MGRFFKDSFVPFLLCLALFSVVGLAFKSTHTTTPVQIGSSATEQKPSVVTGVIASIAEREPLGIQLRDSKLPIINVPADTQVVRGEKTLGVNDLREGQSVRITLKSGIRGLVAEKIEITSAE